MQGFGSSRVSIGLVAIAGAGLCCLCGCGTARYVAEPANAAPLAGRWMDARANVFTSSTQAATTVDFFADGNIVVAWDSRRQQDGQYGVYARVLNAAGEPLTPEVQVNEYTHNAQSDPAVAAANCTAWIVWTSFGQRSRGTAVVARQFDHNLVPLTGEIILNDRAPGHQSDPAIAFNRRGEAMVVWNTVDDAGGGMRIEGRLLGSNGTTRGDVFAIAAPAHAVDSLPAIAGAGDDFVLAWSRRSDATATCSTVLAARLDAGGRSVGEVREVSEELATGENLEPAVAGNDAGGFAVAWHHGAAGAGDHRVAVRRFDQDNVPVHGPVFVSNPDAGWVSGAAVALEGAGRSLVTWNQWAVDGDGLGIISRWVEADGRIEGESFPITAAHGGHQSLTIASNAPRMACTARGQIAIAWSGDSGLGDDSAANVSIYLPSTVVAARPPAGALALATAAEAPIAPIPPTFDPNFEPLPPPEDPGDGASGGFMGINFTGWTPPDPEIAVGPDHLVAITNGAIAFFDYNGTLLFQDEIEGGGGFWGAQGATGFVFDPECLYDPHSGRFFAMACERGSNGLSYYLLAVSDDSNPMGTWHKYRIHTPVDNDIDSPNMAVDDTVVYLTADFFGPDKYGVLMIEKTPILSGGAINSRSFTITGSGDQSMGIPIIYDTGAPAGYLIQSSEGTGNGITFSEVRFHGIQNQLTTPTRVTVDVTVPAYSYPNQPPQMGTSNRPFLFEPRFWSCMYVGGSMWAIHHVNNSRARGRWYEFEMNGWPDSSQVPTLRQWGELDYGGTVHTFFPSVAADADGNAAFVFARSSPSEFISMCGTFRLASDALGTTRPMFFLKNSTVPYTGAARWGDYSHVEPHPDSGAFPTFWGMHEWTDTSNAWRTWIARIDLIPDIATLTDFNVQFGTLISGGLPQLLESDNQRVRVRSQTGFNANEPNLVDLRIGAATANLSAATLNLSVEGRISQPGGTSRLRLRNWSTNGFEQIHQYAIGMTETIEPVNGIPAANRIRQSDGRIQLSIRQVVLATFSVQGFDSFTDHVVISPQ